MGNRGKRNEQFQVIYADPPWKFGSGGARGAKYGALDYPSMTKEELKAMDVERIASTDAALFMWVTGAHVAEAVEVGAAWGFEYKRIDKVWVKKTATGKPHVVPGPWGLTDVEAILLFVRGSPLKLQAVRNQRVAYEAAYPGKHSEKPALFRDLITERFPKARRVELFARSRFPGWEAFGNEVEGGITINQR